MKEKSNDFCQYVQIALKTDGVIYDPSLLKLKNENGVVYGNIIGLALVGKYDKKEAEIISVYASDDVANKLLGLKTEQAIYIREAEKERRQLSEILDKYKSVRL